MDCFIDGYDNPVQVLKDSKLSVTARLIFACYVFGVFTTAMKVESMEQILGIGRDTRKKAMKELQQFGLCTFEKYRDKLPTTLYGMELRESLYCNNA